MVVQYNHWYNSLVLIPVDNSKKNTPRQVDLTCHHELGQKWGGLKEQLMMYKGVQSLELTCRMGFAIYRRKRRIDR